MCLKRMTEREGRSIEQISEQYEIEKVLATRLMSASKEERKNLYSRVYDEFHKRVLLNPQFAYKSDEETEREAVAVQMKFLSNFLRPECTFLNLGAGDCKLSLEVAKCVRRVYAIEVSREITRNLQRPSNFELILSDGTSFDVPPGTVNIVYSSQFVEHIHPDDFLEVLKCTYNALVQGGIYICSTPNRLRGPHDISKYFDELATGLHLKEYTNKELYCLLKSVGFLKVQSYMGGGRLKCVKFPIYFVMLVEYLLEALPHSLRKGISMSTLFRFLLGIRLIATK